MADEQLIGRYRYWYRKLLGLYSKPHQDRFALSMEQTFQDLCRKRAAEGRSLDSLVLWIFAETAAGILRENGRHLIMQNKIVRLAVVTGCILLIPMFGNRYIEGCNWSLFDFIAAGTLLFGTGLIYQLIARKGGTTAYRMAVGIACLTGLLLVWINGAVGIIGSEDNPANALYFGVIFVGMIGAAAAGLQPRGMARTLFAMAVAQGIVPVIALVVWQPDFSPGVIQVFILNAFFVTAWIVSGLLFRQADGVHAAA